MPLVSASDPHLEKNGLDTNNYTNFRPVSNHPSKFLEGVQQAKLLITYDQAKRNLHDVPQSAYQPKHSMETALLKIKCDIEPGS